MKKTTCRVVSTKQELASCYSIRKSVFVDEQGLFDDTDLDGIDDRAVHIAAWYGDTIIGTVRMHEAEPGIWWGSRLAVVKGHRGRAGRVLVEKAVAEARKIGARAFYAHVQIENRDFFKSLKWTSLGDAFMFRGAKHICMQAPL